MQDNSFGKNIEEELHDLSIEPSEQVWVAVEKELDKKKRRFLAGGWWLPLLFLTGTGTIWYFQKNTPAENRQQLLTEKESITTKQSQDQTTPLLQNSSDQNTITANDNRINVTAPDQDNIDITLKKYTQPARTAINIKTAIPVDEVNNSSTLKKRITEGKTRMKITTAFSDEEELADTMQAITGIVQEKSLPTFPEKIKQDSLFDIAKEEIKEVAKTTLADSLEKKSEANKKQKKSKWKKEWAVAAGGSSLGRLDLARSEFYIQDAGQIGSPANPFVSRRYNFHRGVYLQVGFNMGRNLSSKISWYSGLQYSIQTIEASLKKDSAGLYSTRTNWTATTHNLNIPLLLKFSLNNKIDINTGLFNNITLSSNWNKYESVLGAQKKYTPSFYLNPSFNFNSFSVGPLLNIGLTQYNNQQHLVNYGLQLKYIPKK